jgi:hypothetical protein
MKKLFYSAFAYMILGLAAGLFYREFTKARSFPEDASSQLSVVHTHLLVLGFIVLLLVLVLEKLFVLTQSRAFSWFFVTYNAGLILSVVTMVWHGTLTVLGEESNAMIAGIAGLGHIGLTIGMVFLFVALRNRLRQQNWQPNHTPAEVR